MQTQLDRSEINKHQSVSLKSLLNVMEEEHTASYEHTTHRKRSATMSIESILDSGNKNDIDQSIKKAKHSAINNDYFKNNIITPVSPPFQSLKKNSSSIITCYHATIAQKSYGLEKRFLCPPPFVTISDETNDDFLVSMRVVCESTNRQLEQRVTLDKNIEGYLKHLYVTGTAKELYLRVDLRQQMKSSLHTYSPPTTFYSNPVTIISKPSKKSARIRNSSACLYKDSLVSLFNRINSQTVRTKYLSSESNKLCAKSTSWAPFEILVVKQPSQAVHPNHHSVITPITYGTQIVLKDVKTGFSSPLVTICKVEKGKLSPSGYGLVIQLQKVALKLASSEEPLFLSANGTAIQDSSNGSGNIQNDASTWLNFVKSNHPEDLEAALCWTIVGVSKVEHKLDEQPRLWSQMQQQLSPPPSPPKTLVPFQMMSTFKCNNN